MNGLQLNDFDAVLVLAKDNSISVGMYPTTAPVLPATVSFTTGGNIPSGAIVFYRLTEINGSGEGQPSLEGYAKSPMAGARLSIGEPAVVNPATGWNVSRGF